jgi:hypothetical protein
MKNVRTIPQVLNITAINGAGGPAEVGSLPAP